MVKITQVTEDNGIRYYEIDFDNIKPKKKFKSVTTLINYFSPKDVLKKWKESVGEEEAKAISYSSSARGNKVHKFIEDYFLKNAIPEENENLIYFTKLMPVINNIIPIYIEEKIFWEDKNNELVGFGGTVDIFGKISTNNFKLRSGKELPEIITFVGDWKTWNKVKYPVAKTRDGDKYYPLISYYLQLSAYSAAINQMTEAKYKTNECFIFGVTDNCKQPFIYYLDKNAVNYYWSKMKELINSYYNKNTFFDWLLFQKEADDLGHLGERVDIDGK